MTRFFSLILLIVLLAGCAGGGSDDVSPLAAATGTPQPTPTLVPALATLQPTAPSTPAPGETAVAPPDAALDTSLKTAATKPTATPTPTPTPLPTPTPQPDLLISNGHTHLANGNIAAAVTDLESALRQRPALADAQVYAILYDLSLAYLQDGQPAAARGALTELLGLGDTLDNEQHEAALYFYLGQANAALGEYQAAIQAYRSYLEANPDMATYVNPFVAEAYFALGDREGGIAAYEAALSGAGYRLARIDLHRKLADFYLNDGDFAAAIAQYDAIHEMAVTELTRGEMTYLAGTAELLAGNQAAGFERYLLGITSYPRAYESYLGLVALVEAGVAVDEFQRGLVDYYAGVYEPAVAAFERYLESNPDNVRADTYLYLAWSYESLGNIDAALAALDNYAVDSAAAATLERAALLGRAGNGAAALDAYLAYLDNYPDAPDAPAAAWWAAQWTEWLGDATTAIERYRFLAAAYPASEDAPEALFRAGLLAEQSGEWETAVATWLELSETYPGGEYSAATLVWLLRAVDSATGAQPTPTRAAAPASALTTTLPISATSPVSDTAVLRARLENLALNNSGAGYYALRAREIVRSGLPFAPAVPDLARANSTMQQTEMAEWLRSWLALESTTSVQELSPLIAGDTRYIVGAKLWELGLQEAAKRELESLRQSYADNALFSYQLAIVFRDLGLYRSSILAAESVLLLSGQSIFEVPQYLAQLIYPVYFADLILPLAEQHEYDPLLQFALVRQESLFESFARSGAAAQGLSQVIPDTGAYIAQQLNWPDYENADLYRPYVGLNFGAFYLAEQLDAFDNFVPAALSAYNAGPGNAYRWYAEAGVDHDRYLETVNFPETHTYIKRIYVGHTVYKYLYGE